ncbi:MAG: hypothetical protein ACRDWS_01380 [Acidimicrobiia bacterium]
MGRRAAFLGLAIFLALIFYTSLTLATTLDGCHDIMARVVCEPGAHQVVGPV